MSRKDFIVRATRKLERALSIPIGWWGTWSDVHGPGGERVRFAGGGRWIASINGRKRSAHDTRAAAIRRARKLRSTLR